MDVVVDVCPVECRTSTERHLRHDSELAHSWSSDANDSSGCSTPLST